MKALITYTSGGETHAEDVQTAFEAGGGVLSDKYEINPLNYSNIFEYADANGYDAIIHSYEALPDINTQANSYPHIMTFVPSRELDLYPLQTVITECEDDPQGGTYEFLDNTQSADSYSNGYICGQLFSIASQRGCSLQEARIVANLTAISRIIEVDLAVAYSGTVQLTVGDITASRTSGMSVSLTLDRVIDATSYKIYRNGGLITTQTGLTYTDTLPYYDTYIYTYKGYNDNLTSELSDGSTVKYNAKPYLALV